MDDISIKHDIFLIPLYEENPYNSFKLSFYCDDLKSIKHLLKIYDEFTPGSMFRLALNKKYYRQFVSISKRSRAEVL